MAITVKVKRNIKGKSKGKSHEWKKTYFTEEKLEQIAPECLELGLQDFDKYPQFNKVEYLENFMPNDIGMNCLDLFSGIGGFSLACKWAGIKTVGYCDNEPYTINVMKKNFPNAIHFDDVITLNKDLFEKKWKEEKGNEEEIPQIQLVTAGSCCQGYSQLGLQKGNDDARSLQLEAIRISSEFRSPWLLFENVDEFTDMALTSLLSDLANAGYQAESFLAPASAVNALHTRDRAIIVCFNEHFLLQYSCSDRWTNGYTFKERPEGRSEEFGRANTACRQGFNGRPLDKPGVSRTINGLPQGLDESIKSRLKACGNTVVPQFIYPFVRHIKLVHTLLVKDQERLKATKNNTEYGSEKISEFVTDFKNDATKLAALKDSFIQVDGLIYFNYQCNGDKSKCEYRHEKYNLIEDTPKAARTCEWFKYSKLPNCWMNISDLDELNSGEKFAELINLGEYKENRWKYDMILDEILDERLLTLDSDLNFDECVEFWTILEQQIQVLKCNVFYRRE